MKEKIIDVRSDYHWTDEEFKQRMTTKQWKKLLLEGEDKLIFRGKVTQLVAKKLGYGVVEVSKNLEEK